GPSRVFGSQPATRPRSPDATGTRKSDGEWCCPSFAAARSGRTDRPAGIVGRALRAGLHSRLAPVLPARSRTVPGVAVANLPVATTALLVHREEASSSDA